MGRPLPSGLGVALDEAQVEPGLVAALPPELGRVRRVQCSVLKRRTLRYELELDGPVPHLSLIGKVYESESAGERGFAAIRWLGAQDLGTRSRGCVQVPRAVAYLPEFALLLMEEAGGSSLQRLLRHGDARPEHAQLYARALLELHTVPAALGAPFTLDDHLAVRCAGLTGALQQAFPDLGGPIERLLASARSAERGQLAPACTLAHGDYHPGQVHLEGERLWLVDLDPLHQGNPAYDLAMAVFSFQRLEPAPAETGQIGPLLATFLATYFAHIEPRRAARLPLDMALIYLKRACKRFRYQDEDRWPAAVRQQIAEAERCLAWLEAARPPSTLGEVLELCGGFPRPRA